MSLILTVLAVVLALGAGWWAKQVTLAQPVADDDSVAVEPVWAEAREASVGKSLQYATTLYQPTVPVAFNSLPGVVTRVSPGEVKLGDVIYAVGDVPVRAVKLSTPMWRDLARKHDGDDVRALQKLLAKLGHFSGEVTGSFGAATESAVKAWQKAEGRAQTGTVARGELVALPRLPITLSLGEEIALGRVLAGGEEAVLAPTGDREFALVLTQDQARLVPVEATVEIAFEEHSWPAVIAGSRTDESGQVRFDLVAPDGGEVCADACDELPLDEQVTLRSEVIAIPAVSGVGVPVAAVRTTPSGDAFVITGSGEQPVTVLGSGQGIAIVDGIETGTRVEVGRQAGGQPESPEEPAESSPTTVPTEEG